MNKTTYLFHNILKIFYSWILLEKYLIFSATLSKTLPEADIVESLVIDTVGLVCVLNELVDGEGGVVGLHHGVRHLGRGDDGVGVHDPVRVLLPDLGDEKGSHAGAGAAAKGVCQLESLQAVAALGLLPHHVQHRVHQLSAYTSKRYNQLNSASLCE